MGSRDLIIFLLWMKDKFIYFLSKQFYVVLDYNEFQFWFKKLAYLTLYSGYFETQ